MEPVNNDTIEGVETFEDRLGKTLTLWNGREVKAFPCVETIRSAPPGENSWRSWKSLDSMFYDPYLILTKCGACDEKLVDYFYETRSFTSYAPYEHKIYGMIFHRTCSQCCNDKEKQDHIFENEKLRNSEYTNFKMKGHVYQKYTVKIEPTEENKRHLLNQPSNSPPKNHFPRKLTSFLDNFDSALVDVNESLIAGLFRSFGVVRDSVDFFVCVADILKDKLGINNNNISKVNSVLSDDENILKTLEKGSPLETFRKVFPSGMDIQKSCCDAMGIKYEPNTPFKRVLEELGAAGPFGPLWMAISAAGQVAVESGLVTTTEKPFYEIALALLSHKAARIGKNTPIASEVEKLSKSLESSIDLGKVSSGSSKEIQKASHAVEKFIDIRDLNPPKTGNITLDTAKLLPTQANNVCGWRVGQEINNRTLLGDVPSWSTVRARHWKNKALDHKLGKVTGKLEYEPTLENIKRMEKGLAPQYEVEKTGKIESVELHHEPPQRDGGLFDFEELTVEQHTKKDFHRAGYTNREGATKK